MNYELGIGLWRFRDRGVPILAVRGSPDPAHEMTEGLPSFITHNSKSIIVLKRLIRRARYQVVVYCFHSGNAFRYHFCGGYVILICYHSI